MLGCAYHNRLVCSPQSLGVLTTIAWCAHHNRLVCSPQSLDVLTTIAWCAHHNRLVCSPQSLCVCRGVKYFARRCQSDVSQVLRASHRAGGLPGGVVFGTCFGAACVYYGAACVYYALIVCVVCSLIMCVCTLPRSQLVFICTPTAKEMSERQYYPMLPGTAGRSVCQKPSDALLEYAPRGDTPDGGLCPGIARGGAAT
jgi:hypothetical protein